MITEETQSKFDNLIKRLDNVKEEYKRQIGILLHELVQEYLAETPDYVAKFCVDYISNKLKANYFDTYIMNPTTIFVTWKFIEANKEKLGAR